jgi:hypothetical protein
MGGYASYFVQLEKNAPESALSAALLKRKVSSNFYELKMNLLVVI